MPIEVQIPSPDLTITSQEQIETLKDVLQRTAPKSLCGEMTSSFAHEINNPVCAILNLLELASEEVDENIPVRQYLSEAQTETERISDTVRDLQCIDRADNSAPEWFDPARAVQSVMTVLQKRYIKNGIELVQDHTDAEFSIFGVRGKLMRAVIDLCINAERAVTNSSSPKVEVQTAISENGWFRLTIIDNGMGLSNHDSDNLFHPMISYWNPPGAGLGLYRTKKIAESMNGSIILTNRNGHSGAAATIELPPSRIRS
jgi:C4-dicarboxylate-specific signal transduction histidine kinase